MLNIFSTCRVVLMSLIALAVFTLPAFAQDDQGGTVSGHVYESDGVTPVVGDVWVVVEMFDGGYLHQAAVEADGGYIITGLPEGNYRARTSGVDYVPSFYHDPATAGDSVTVLWIDDGDTVSDVDFSLQPGGTISGRVYGEDGITPVSHMLVELAGRWVGTCTDDEGYYVLSGVPLNAPQVVSAGAYNWCGGGFISPYHVWWGHAFSEAEAQPITLTIEDQHLEHINFVLGLTNTSTLRATVDMQGRPPKADARWVTPVHVMIASLDSGAILFDDTVMTNELGIFVLEDLLSGPVRIWVKGENTLANAIEYDMRTGENSYILLGTLLEGDANDDNAVTITDFSILANTFGKVEGDEDYDVRADFNGDDVITIIDFSLLASNFSQIGAP